MVLPLRVGGRGGTAVFGAGDGPIMSLSTTADSTEIIQIQMNGVTWKDTLTHNYSENIQISLHIKVFTFFFTFPMIHRLFL